MSYNWSHKTILIAEDDYLSYRILKSYLRRTNAQILWAEDGKRAVDLYQETPKLDLIIMDIRMPVMNGFEATRKIREKNKKLPILAHSAFHYEEFNANCKDAGCDAYIPKPSSNEEILEKANTLMAKESMQYSKAR